MLSAPYAAAAARPSRYAFPIPAPRPPKNPSHEKDQSLQERNSIRTSSFARAIAPTRLATSGPVVKSYGSSAQHPSGNRFG